MLAGEERDIFEGEFADRIARNPVDDRDLPTNLGVPATVPLGSPTIATSIVDLISFINDPRGQCRSIAA